MTRKTLQKANSRSSSTFTEILTKKGQQTSVKNSKQNISTLKKVQNDKTQKLATSSETLITNKIQKELSKNTNNSLKLADKFSNNSNSDKSNSDDSEIEESNEEFKDELGDED